MSVLEPTGVVRRYDSEGWHRTGNKVAIRSIRGIRNLLNASGYDAVLEPFLFRRLIPSRSGVLADERWIPGVPLFDGGLTPPEGRTIHLSTEVTPGLAPIIRVQPMPQEHPIDDLRRRDDIPGIIDVTTGGAAGLALRNAPHADRPFGPPVLQVSSRYLSRLHELANLGVTVQLTVTGRWVLGRGYNLVVDLGGRSRSFPLVVMTPHTGWWFCAGERGGGIACWLAALRAVSKLRSGRRVVLVVTQGHELAHPGLRSFMAVHPDLDVADATWLHLGANLGASDSTLKVHGDVVSDASILADSLALAGEVGPLHSEGRIGDARQVKLAATISLTGVNNRHFHLVTDRADNVDDARLLNIASAVAETARKLAAIN